MPSATLHSARPVLFALGLAAMAHATGIHSPATHRIWVLFADKPDHARHVPAAPRGLARRRAVGFPRVSYGDLPVAQRYLSAVERTGATRRHVVKWVNAASFAATTGQIRRIRALPFVKGVKPVRRFARRPAPPVQGGFQKKRNRIPGIYGPSFRQLDLVGVTAAHDYITRRTGAEPGAGVLVGVFDTGFFFGHKCLQRLTVVADSDFVELDGEVMDRDRSGGSHGAQTLSLIGGYAPQSFMGSAWGAQFLLARTENDFVEAHTEEDNWAAAIVWAESLGVDIVSSSLGYRDGFTDSIGDYTFEDMDGKTTIISMAADSAVQRGVIVVNSMGNEGSNYPSGDSMTYEFGTLSAPADVEGVVSVGAVSPSGRIASFSSLGPTADSTTKPDLVAQGVGVIVPDPVGPGDSYNMGSGTSYSAPVVAGICALIRQSHPGLQPQTIREKLYASCRLTPYQSEVDNIYGRGLPDALLACMKSNQVYIQTRDSLGNLIPGVVVYGPAGSELAQTDSMGVALITLGSPPLPDTLNLSFGGGQQPRMLVIRELPSRHTVMLEIRKQIVVSVQADSARPVAGAEVFWKPGSASSFRRQETNAKGTTTLTYHTTDPCSIYVRAGGYYPSDTLVVATDSTVCSRTVRLHRRPLSRFVLYPNVVDVRRPDQRVKVEFVPGMDKPGEHNQVLKAAVRSSSGALVWQHAQYIDEYVPVTISFACRSKTNKPLAPGTYFFIIRYGHERYIRKFFVVG